MNYTRATRDSHLCRLMAQVGVLRLRESVVSGARYRAAVYTSRVGRQPLTRKVVVTALAVTTNTDVGPLRKHRSSLSVARRWLQLLRRKEERADSRPTLRRFAWKETLRVRGEDSRGGRCLLWKVTAVDVT